jgi:hypothetical protein
MASTAFPLISFPEKTSPGRHPLVLSQGEVRPGVKQGQYWGAPPSWGRSAPPVPAYDINTTVAL